MKVIFEEENEPGIFNEDLCDVDSIREHPPLVHFQTVKDYERLFKPADLARAILTMDHESVLIRRPLYWTKDGEAIPDASALMSLEELCEANGWKIVARYGDHFAVAAPEEM